MKRRWIEIILPLVGSLVLCLFIWGRAVLAKDADTVTATISYYYYDADAPDGKGDSPYPPFVANMPKGATSLVETSPKIPGYSPSESAVTVSFLEDSTTEVFYYPAQVPYVIQLNLQNIGDNGYTTDCIKNGTGLTGTVPKEFTSDAEYDLANLYPGYTMMYYMPDIIAADGSTEFQCYYDRNYYFVDVSLGNGGYGAESVYARYESPFLLAVPSRPGFVFDGWTVTRKSDGYLVEDISETGTFYGTVPAYDLLFTAKWKTESNTRYRIIYKYADVDTGDGITTYSYWGSTLVETATPGDKLDVDAIIQQYQGNAVSFSDGAYFTFDAEATKSRIGSDTITVAGDGSTMIALYYKRNVYTIRYVYARQAVTENVLVASSEIQSGHTYLIVNNSKDRALSATASGNFLLEEQWSETYAYGWTVTQKEDGSYTVAYNEKYLTFSNAAASLTQEETVLTLTYDALSQTWSIQKGNSYLNDYYGQGRYAGGYGSLDAGSKWRLYDVTEKTYETILGQIEISNSTGNGDYTSNSMLWRYRISTLPQINTSNGALALGTMYDTARAYQLYYISLTAEYGADIEALWPAAAVGSVDGYSFGSWAAQAGSGYRSKYGDAYANIVGKYPTMSSDMIVDPASEIAQTMYAWWGTAASNISTHRYLIYYESLPGEPEDENINGVSYTYNRTLEFTAAHNGNTRVDPFVYNGFTILDKEKGGYSNSQDATTSPVDASGVYTTTFHYLRNVHTIQYYNYSSIYENPNIDSNRVRYGQSLADFFPTETPPYPDGLEPGKYEFVGWYDSDTYETEFNWDSQTMPDSDLVVYAYWKPKTFTVRFYDSLDAYLKAPDSPIATAQVLYGSSVDDTTAYQLLTPPTFQIDGVSEQAEEVGWFSMDDSGNLHAFHTKAMTISGNLDLFMEWTTTVPTYYVIHYRDGTTGEAVADDTEGYSFVRLTRTFQAKRNSKLYTQYQSYYFPDKDSTSLLLHTSGNETTFYYWRNQQISYQVRYIDRETGEELYPTKIVTNNENAIVTERYVPIAGYNPHSYYLSLTLTVTTAGTADDAHNVLTFYYTADESNMLYHVKYLLEDESGTYQCIDANQQEVFFDDESLYFQEINYMNAIGEINTSISIPILPYVGYTPCCYQIREYSTDYESFHVVNKYDPVRLDPSDANIPFLLHVSDDVDSQEIRIYYKKNKYDVKVSYEINSDIPQKVQEWNEMLFGAFGDSAMEILQADTTSDAVEVDDNVYYKRYYRIVSQQKYGTTYSTSAPELDGFQIVGKTSKQTVVIVPDGSYENNAISFSYTARESIMLYYKAVFPLGSDGTKIADTEEAKVLSINQESVTIGERPQNSVIAMLESAIISLRDGTSTKLAPIPFYVPPMPHGKAIFLAEKAIRF